MIIKKIVQNFILKMLMNVEIKLTVVTLMQSALILKEATLVNVILAILAMVLLVKVGNSIAPAHRRCFSNKLVPSNIYQ